MQLYSLQFVLFLILALIAYYAVGRIAHKGQWIVLLVASLGFYFASGWQHLFFILTTALTTWLLARKFASIEAKSKEERKQVKDRKERKAIKARYNKRKWKFLLLGLIINFGILSYIKYWNAILGIFSMQDSFLASHLLLPLGISFYTFQSMSYLIDTYNAKYEPEKNFAKFLLFVSWFPQLIQGPINRFNDLAQQLYAEHHFDAERSRRALLLIGFGMLKKYVMADMLVNSIAACLDHVTPDTPGSVIVFGILLYSAQQYGDFSGGIDMVRGVSHLFGVEMKDNFRQPYFSISLADFWRRWHITLGTWMRDYVFYPFALIKPMHALGEWANKHLGRHLGRTLPACIANILVFFLVGLWHGADAHFIWWGLYNGIVIALADLLGPLWEKMNHATHIEDHPGLQHLWRIIRTFIVVNIGWYFDRILVFSHVLQGFHNTFFNFNIAGFMPYLNMIHVDNIKISLILSIIACIIVFIVSVLRERDVDVAGGLLKRNFVLRYALYVCIGVLILFSFLFAPSNGGFIYANF